MTDKDKIDIMLNEYNSLRTEILSRGNITVQVSTASAAFLTWLLTRELNVWAYFVIPVFIFSILILYWWTWHDCLFTSRRLIEIEHEINKRAGEELLAWESEWGGIPSGFFRNLTKKGRSIHKK